MLLVAKLDTLTSNVHFLTTLLESGVRFRAVEMPEADKRMFQLMLVLAEWEARQASRRPKAALQAAKARGVRLGNPTILAAGNTARREAAQSRAEALWPTLQGLRQREGLASGDSRGTEPLECACGPWRQVVVHAATAGPETAWIYG